jgi:hypothetical protein
VKCPITCVATTMPDTHPKPILRTRATRKTITAPVTEDELARAKTNAAERKLTLAEYVRTRCCR